MAVQATCRDYIAAAKMEKLDKSRKKQLKLGSCNDLQVISDYVTIQA